MEELLWHERLSHQNTKYVNYNILKTHNIKLKDNGNQSFIGSCVIGNQHKETFKSRTFKEHENCRRRT